jgi:hypothetical protein
MSRIGYLLLNIAAALYLFVNGIVGVTQQDGGFRSMLGTIIGGGDFTKILAIVLSVCAIAAGVFLLLQIFKIVVPVTDIILLAFIVLWAVYIVIVNVLGPLNNGIPNFLEFAAGLSAHLMVLGTLASSTKRFA